MDVSLSGAVGAAFIFGVCVLSFAIIALGSWVIFSWFVLDILLKQALLYFNAYKTVIGWAMYRKKIKAFFDTYLVDEYARHNALVRQQIIQELKFTLQQLGASSDVLASVNSVGDTLNDDEVLYLLKKFNEDGTIMETVIASVDKPNEKNSITGH